MMQTSVLPTSVIKGQPAINDYASQQPKYLKTNNSSPMSRLLPSMRLSNGGDHS